MLFFRGGQGGTGASWSSDYYAVHDYLYHYYYSPTIMLFMTRTSSRPPTNKKTRECRTPSCPPPLMYYNTVYYTLQYSTLLYYNILCCIYTYIYIYRYRYVHICIYIYRERERYTYYYYPNLPSKLSKLTRHGDDDAPQAVTLARRTIIYYTISYDNILYCNLL